MRYTFALVKVGLTLAAKPLDEQWAYDVGLRAQLRRPDSASTVMARMLDHGWLVAIRRKHGLAGKPRLLVRVTTKGIDELRKVCAFADGKPLYAQWMPPHGALDVSPDDVPAPRQEPVIGATPLTYSTVVVGLVISSRPNDEHWAQGIARPTQLQHGTVARILSRMTADGWLRHRRETGRKGRGRPRRLYTVTPAGIAGLRGICEHAKDNPEYNEWLPEVFPHAPDEGPDDDQDDDQDDAAIPRQDRMYFDSFPRPKLPELPRGRCQECGVARTLLDDGTVPNHTTEPGVRCNGSQRLPAREHPDHQPAKGTR